MGTGCHEHCFLKTFVKDGKIVRTERGVLGEPEVDRYGICQKGIEYAKFPDSPARLLYPLKRVGERGEGKFERISWEQAMNEIGAKLRQIRDQYGPEAIALNAFACGYPANWTTLHMILMYRFVHTFGASLEMMETIDEGYFFATQFDLGSSWQYAAYDCRLLPQAKYILIWGSQPLGATRASATSRNLLDAQENGAKIVDIGLTFDATAAKADEFVPIKGGTDAALALAMNHVLIEDGLIDTDYVTRFTVAPFLVRQDNGKFLRQSDIVPGGSSNYVFWNALPAEPRTIAAGSHDFGDAVPDLLAAPVVEGISCKTAFLKLKEHLAQWTPEYQESITGVPANTVRRLAHEYVDNKPATIWLNLGLRYYNAREAHRAIQLLSALSGNLGLKGGKLALIAWNDGWPVSLNDVPIVFPDGPEKAKGAMEDCTSFIESFRGSEPPKYRALLNIMGNPVQAWPNRQLWVNDVLPKLDLIVDYEVRLSETAKFADYVLPDTTTFERYELLVPQGNWAVLNEPAIAPMGEAKPPAEFWRLLAEQVGVGDYFQKNTEEWLDLRLQSQDPSIAGVKPPLTLERLKKEKMVRLNVPSNPFDPFEAFGFITPSGRFEFYCEDMAEADEAMAKWVPALIHSSKRKDYPLQLYVARHRMFMQTQFTDFPDLRAIAGKRPWMWINPQDAAARGIRSGDAVEVFNDMGKLSLMAVVSNAVPAGVVEMWYGFRRDEYANGAPTELMVPIATKLTFDKAAQTWLDVVKRRWALPPGEAPSWAGLAAGKLPATMNLEVQIAGNYDLMWDNLCEVRKVEGGK
jgi:molybdopterin-containing oxidoreductase family molybdopterin binding subunit